MKKLKSQEQAAVYVTRLYSGELTAKEEAELQQWRSESAQHEADFNEMLSLWDVSGQLFQSPAQTRRPHSRKKRALPWLAAAATLFMSIGLVTIWSLQGATPSDKQALAENSVADEAVVSDAVTAGKVAPADLAKDEFRITQYQETRPELNRRYQTAVGEVRMVRLPDGSEISLNTDSKISVTLDKGQRLVTLERGEVFFDIAKDPSRPFNIDTGTRVIEVLGTQFNVRKRADEDVVQVAVVEGKVSVQARQKQSTAASAADANQAVEANVEGPSLLLAGYIGSYSDASEVVSRDKTREVDSAQTWRRGVFRFDNERLEKVVREFNRYRTTKIEFGDATSSELRISGVFHLKDNHSILTALESTLPIEVQRQAGSIKIVQK